MECPKCKSRRLMVVDSRPFQQQIRRRRECQACGHRLTTYERTVEQHDQAIAETTIARARACLDRVFADLAEPETAA